MSGEPQTAAGRLAIEREAHWPQSQRRLRRVVLAVEADAIAQERERLAAAVRALPEMRTWRGNLVDVGSVLAVVAGGCGCPPGHVDVRHHHPYVQGADR